ncbi:hypothetical protein FGSG_04462 [Fusarium graminearum PH-1]|uniref:Chromosome 2, complete genome n=1 Tax=Gibberella zeae (strain ATCC MYA-4620 / CBS 123657 / FGSC 9075 / NRRL 31084 / PH-1) TaxID=229533 RepID=I1RKP9_GIBZE|nr:hypothetical protein FGSG_04462 [Fusarium graminearum PH-1]ESU08637.1 hypothetical protein FGSG_04462 [Fusarium graminearum PH-1]EYB24981.1 hypothetical protein FG05_04462 [Fusarium graminearum]CAF3532618.1 unnamed protein product [Fusarium graminearum]CEF79482.1 unnamed protein product [Fusarium graminearum]|eukprot:XP_011321136.1 hypothetical protein FGSG_04462 [Fusarium graminearum PH-1]
MASESAFIEQPDIDCEALDEALDESPLELSVSGEKPPVHSNELKKQETEKGKGKEIAENDTLPMVHESSTEEAEAEKAWNEQSGFSEPWRQLHPGVWIQLLPYKKPSNGETSAGEASAEHTGAEEVLDDKVLDDEVSGEDVSGEEISTEEALDEEAVDEEASTDQAAFEQTLPGPFEDEDDYEEFT